MTPVCIFHPGIWWLCLALKHVWSAVSVSTVNCKMRTPHHLYKRLVGEVRFLAEVNVYLLQSPIIFDFSFPRL